MAFKVGSPRRGGYICQTPAASILSAGVDVVTPPCQAGTEGGVAPLETPMPAEGSTVQALGPAEAVLPCADLGPTLAFFVERLGFRVEVIFPADEPQVATLCGHGMRLRLAPGAGDPGTIRIAAVDAGGDLAAPNGTRIVFYDPDPPLQVPPLQPAFVLTRAGEGPASGAGRAGMLYRDLIPGRLGGRFIASHISIPQGGPVADWVHFHKIRFQMIFCRKGWVRVVYEDQGPPFVLEAGDCVLQPPRIRHRVLEASPGLEVVEIGCPALHETLADHHLPLPTGLLDPARDFDGQRFLRHVAAQTPWAPHGAGGFERCDTGMARATGGLAEARVIRPAGGARGFAADGYDGELLFGFVLEGRAVLEHAGAHALGPCDAFVIPPGQPWGLAEASDDLQLLEVILPAGASTA
jgi:quercetin dioxygenase-like cupin family protein